MDLTFFLQSVTPKAYEDLTVDDTAGGVGFGPDKLVWGGVPAKIVRVTVEGGDLRSKEVAEAPTATSGDLHVDGDEFFVPGTEAIKNFRAIRTGAENATLRCHVYF
jgi:hypothetical protein